MCCVCVCMPSNPHEKDWRNLQSLIGVNLKLSFSSNDGHTKVKGPSLSIDVQIILVYLSFLKKKANSIVHDLNYVCRINFLRFERFLINENR